MQLEQVACNSTVIQHAGSFPNEFSRKSSANFKMYVPPNVSTWTLYTELSSVG